MNRAWLLFEGIVADGPPVLCAIGVVASVTLMATHAFFWRNPSRIALSRVWRRWLGGAALFILAWSAIGVGACYGLQPHLRRLPPWATTHYPIFAFIGGLILPHLSRAADLAILRKPWLRHLVKILIPLSDITYRYFSKILNREERKLGLLASQDEYKHAIDRLFEWHVEHIGHHLAQHHEPARVRGICAIRHHANKLRLLTRYRGATKVLRDLEAIVASPRCILPTWPLNVQRRVNTEDRRRRNHQEANPERRLMPRGRRKTDSRYVWEYVVHG